MNENNKPNRNRPRPAGQNKPNQPKLQPVANGGRSVSRGAAMRAQRRTQEDAHRIANQYLDAGSKNQPERRANFIDDQPRLKIIGLGGMDGGGSKNMRRGIDLRCDVRLLVCGAGHALLRHAKHFGHRSLLAVASVGLVYFDRPVLADFC
jgi:hypothetical protein